MTQLKGKLWQQLENDLVNGKYKPDDLKLKLAKYMYVHEPEHFDKRVNNKPKEKKKSIPLVKFESTFDAYLHDKQKEYHYNGRKQFG